MSDTSRNNKKNISRSQEIDETPKFIFRKVIAKARSHGTDFGACTLRVPLHTMGCYGSCAIPPGQPSISFDDTSG